MTTAGEQRTLLGLIATKLGAMVFVFMAGVVAARTLGAGGKGEVDVALGLFALLLLLAPSIEEPQLILLAKEPAAAGRLAVNGLVLALGFGLLVLAVWWCVLGSGSGVVTLFMPRSGAQAAPPELVWLMLTAPFEILSRLLAGVLQGRRRMRSFMLVVLIRHAVVLSAMLLLVLGFELGVTGAVQAWALGALSAAASAAWFVFRDTELRANGLRCDLRLMRAQIGGGLRAQGAVVAVAVILNGDQLILWHFHGAAAVGIYALAAAITGQLRRLMVQPVKELLGSQVQQTAHDKEVLADAITRGVRRVLVLLLPPSLLLALVIWPALLLVYGEAFLSAAEPVWVLLPGGLFWAVAVVLSWWFMGQNRFGVLTLAALGIAALNVLLNVLFIPAHGALAAAWTSTLCYALHALLFACAFISGSKRGAGTLWPTAHEFRALWTKPFAAVFGRAAN